MMHPQVTGASSFSMGLPTGPVNSTHHHPSNSTIFKKRFDRIDWKKLAGADVDHISRNLDYFTLQDNIHNVAFCSIESELDLRNVDSNFVKLFKLAQLTIEYLLFSQDYLNSKGKELESLLRKEKEDHEATEKKVEKVQNELAEVKKESHKRKKMILAQQQMLQAGPNAYNKCPFCSKAFVNTSFLQSHLMRRHLDNVGSFNSMVSSQVHHAVPPPQGVEQPLPPPQPAPVIHDTAQAMPVDNRANEVLSQQVEEIRERLRLTESQLVDERNARNSILHQDELEQSRREMDIEREMNKWKHEQAESHREEMDKMREMFMKELKEMNEKYRMAEKNVLDIQHNMNKRVSNLGHLQDDEDKELLAQQREEVAMLREELSHQMGQVEDVMERKMQKKEGEWRSKIKLMSREHEKHLKQMRMALDSSMTELERERDRKGAAENTYQQQVEDLQRLIQQAKGSEQHSGEEEEVLRDSNMPVASRNPPQKTLPVTVPPSPMLPQDEEEEEMEETTELEVTESLEGTSSFGTRTLPTMGTLTISEARTNRLADLIKQNPHIVRELKSQLQVILVQELEKRGVPSTSKGLPAATLKSKMDLLKNERQQTAKRHKNFYEIRQHYINQLELLAKEEVKSQAPTKSKETGTATKPVRPTSAPVRPSSEKARLGQSAPLPSTALPQPRHSSQPPRPAPRAMSPPGTNRNATSVSVSSTGHSFTATSTNWDSDLDDDYDTTEGAGSPEPPAAAGKPNKQVRYEDEEEDDEDNLEEISELEEASDMNPAASQSPAKAITVPRPKGGMVANLSRSIELQLQGRGKKPVGGVNTMSHEGQVSATGVNKAAKSEEDDSFSLITSDEEEEEAPKPSSRRGVGGPVGSSLAADTASYSTNTYGTSMWGSSKVPSGAQPAGAATQGSVGKTSINISEWESDNEFDIDDLGSP